MIDWQPASIEVTLGSAADRAPISATHLIDRWFGARVDQPSIRAYMPVFQSPIASSLIVPVSHEVDRNAAAAVLTGHKTKLCKT